jgi:signal transduction histidine kinase
MQPDLLRRLSFWPLQIGGWTLYTVFPLAAYLVGGIQSPDYLWLAFTRGVSGFVLTTALRPLCQRIFKAKIRYAVLFPLLVVAALVLGVLEWDAMRRIGTLLGIPSSGFAQSEVFGGFVLLRAIVLLLWLLLYFGIQALRQNTETEREFRKAEARLLRSQMNPHFLFNALNTIMAVRKDATKVEAVTQSLADYLRFSLQQEEGKEHGVSTYPLGDELAALEDYLRVEKERFGDDLVCRIDAEEDARRTPVPSALVQPLLENAIKYGQETGPRPLQVSITAQVVQGKLQIEVQNSGHWVEEGSPQAGRIGLSNLKRRLNLIYGHTASLDIRHTPAMVKVCIALPARPLR